VLDDVPRDNAGEQIVAAARRRAHDHAQLLALVERSDVVLGDSWVRKADASNDEQSNPHCR
jgi:hypothetical protein